MFKIDYTVKRIDRDYAILITDGGDGPRSPGAAARGHRRGDRLVCERISSIG